MTITVESLQWPDGSHHWSATRAIDSDTWTVAYELGYRSPNYPMPATLDDAESALNWLMLSSCPHKDGPCNICIGKFIDQILYDFPSLD